MQLSISRHFTHNIGLDLQDLLPIEEFMRRPAIFVLDKILTKCPEHLLRN